MSEEIHISIRGNIESFRTDVEKFSYINNRIKELTDKLKPYMTELKELRAKKVELKKRVCHFMDKNDLDKCAIQDTNSVLMYQKRKVAIPLTREMIRNELIRFFGTCNNREFNALTPEQKGARIFEYIWEDRDYKFSETLLNKPL